MRLKAEHLHAGSILIGALLIGLSGCVATSRIGDYLVGMPVPSAQPQQLATPVRAGLVLAVPEAESAKPTALTRKFQERLTERIQKWFHDPQSVEIKQVLPPITLPGNGLAAITLDRLRELVKDAQISKLFVVVASSQAARRMLPYPRVETQLFARMDMALIDLATGQVLLTDAGQDDYFLLDRYDGVRDIYYPQIFYRAITQSGPFQVVDGDPYVALGEKAFSGAADQLAMRLRERLNLF